MKLTDEAWQKVEGGYRILYDASVPLRQLEQTTNPEKVKNIFAELWEELHHQGDVGIASYIALPQLVRICELKDIFDTNLLGLCCVIEQQRHFGNNPILPNEFQNYYDQGLLDLKDFVLNNINKDLDDSTYTMALATLATCTRRIKLGKAIMELEDRDIVDEFLKQF